MEAASLALLFQAVSGWYGLPVGLLSAICYTESNHREAVVNVNDGGADSIGVCQIKVQTARLVGFTGTPKDLQDPKKNVKYAGKYLRRQLDRYEQDIVKATAAYNTGTLKTDRTGWPMNKRYIRKVFRAWIDGK